MNIIATSRISAGTVLNTKNPVLEYMGTIVTWLYSELNVKLVFLE